MQQVAADYYSGSAGDVVVDGGCSGLALMGLLALVIALYPAPLRARVLGCLGGVALVLAVNTARIAHLGHVGSSFAVFHAWVWPGVLMLTTLGYAVAWMSSLRRA